jgi:hypothetical protein
MALMSINLQDAIEACEQDFGILARPTGCTKADAGLHVSP